MSESIRISTVIPADARQIYQAWMTSRSHSDFTDDKARVDPKISGLFTAWNGYINGSTVELEPYNRIVQTWRATGFPAKSADSKLEVLLEEVEGGTKVTLLHSGIPKGQGADYKQGWIDFYFEPMKSYFLKNRNL